MTRPPMIFALRCAGLMAVTFALSVEVVFPQGSDQQSAKSVVKVQCRLANRQSMEASGFVWSKSTHVVTALHAVAGCSSLEVYSEAALKTAGAKVKTANLEADLALLELDADLGLAPLKIAGAAPNLDEPHHIWGYPHNVPTMQSNPLRFSRSLKASPVLEDLFEKGSRFFRESVAPQGYPKLQSKILRIGSTIQPGHSGAPIFDRQGVVVGIADGGLKGGIAGINWGIPASVYLPGLPSSRDPIPTRPSVQASLFSAPSAADGRVVAAGSTAAGGARTLELSWSAPLGEILELVSDDALADYLDLIDEAKDQTGLDLRDFRIEIYEDYESGATLAVPEGVALTYDAKSGMLEARTEGGGATMIVQIVENETWEAAQAAARAFRSHIEGGEDWRPDPENRDEEEADPASGDSFSDIFRIQVDDDGEVVAELFATLDIDRNDFLGTAVIVYDTQLSAEQQAQSFLMEACTWLADFAIQ